MRRIAIVLAALAPFAASTDARASKADATTFLTYTAAAGETNDVTVSGGPATVTIRDPGATITAGNNCQAVSASEVTCSPPGGPGDAAIDLGDGSDHFDAAAAQTNVRVRGGDGDDTIRGSDYQGFPGSMFSGSGDYIDGGPGTDTIDAGAGDDSVVGGGPDPLAPPGFPGSPPPPVSGAEHDVIDGGAGRDKVTYFDMHAAVTVNLGVPDGQGVPGENDRLTGFEGVETTGSNADTLTGTDANEGFGSDGGADHVSAGGGNDGVGSRGPGAEIDAGAGDDRVSGGIAANIDAGDGNDNVMAAGSSNVVGGRGDDHIAASGAGLGSSHVSGGEGDDKLETRDGSGGDTVICGLGVDRIEADAGDHPSGDCEVLNGAHLAPAAGKAFGAAPKTGTVLVKLPGAGGFQALDAHQQIPDGAQLDTTHGAVRLSTAGDLRKHGRQFAGTFSQGTFRVHEARSAHLVTDLTLTGQLSCGKKKRAGVSAAGKSRRLFGNAHGRFRTRGRHSTATVRGTKWLVKDTCDSTLTMVQRGVVVVRDLVKHKTVIVKAGQHYLARRGNR
jgi:Ca2+-binding RTX toxin-like protein